MKRKGSPVSLILGNGKSKKKKSRVLHEPSLETRKGPAIEVSSPLKEIPDWELSSILHPLVLRLKDRVNVARCWPREVELETMLIFQSCESNHFSANFSEDIFKELFMHNVKSGIFAKVDDYKKSWPLTRDLFFTDPLTKRSIRQEIPIHPNTETEIKWTEKTRLSRDVCACAQNPWGFILNIKKEEQLLENPLSPHIAPSFVRNKNRCSGWWNKLPFRTDFTRVSDGKTDQEARGKPCHWEVETQYITSQKDLEACGLMYPHVVNSSEELLGSLLTCTLRMLPITSPLSLHSLPLELLRKVG